MPAAHHVRFTGGLQLLQTILADSLQHPEPRPGRHLFFHLKQTLFSQRQQTVAHYLPHRRRGCFPTLLVDRAGRFLHTSARANR